MQNKIRHLDSYFQMSAIIGIILVISGAFPEFRDQKVALRVASGALIFPALIGAFLLRRLKKQFLSETAQKPHEESA